MKGLREYKRDLSTRFGSFQPAYECLGRVCSGMERTRLDLGRVQGTTRMPLFVPIFSRRPRGAILAEARLLIKQDRRVGFDRTVLRTIVGARLYNDGEGFRVDVLVEGEWDDAYWGEEDGQRLLAMHDELAAVATSPPSLFAGAMPTSLLILAQELSTRRAAVVNLVHLKDTLYCLTATTTRRRARQKDPEIILYYDAAEGGKVGIQFLKRRHVNALSKAARAIESVDLNLAEKIAQLKQERLIEQAHQLYQARDRAIDAAFQANYFLSEVDPMFVFFAVQNLHAFSSSMRVIGGSLRFDGTAITGAGRVTGNVFKDAGSIGEAFKDGGSGDDGVVILIIIVVAIILFLVTVGIVVWGIQQIMTHTEHGGTSMTYYISGKNTIHKYRAPQIYTDDLKSK